MIEVFKSWIKKVYSCYIKGRHVLSEHREDSEHGDIKSCYCGRIIRTKDYVIDTQTGDRKIVDYSSFKVKK